MYGVELPPELQNKDEESDEEEGNKSIYLINRMHNTYVFVKIKDIHALNYTFAREDTQEVEYKAKNDMYGIGYDPYTTAPEFRDKKGIILLILIRNHYYKKDVLLIELLQPKQVNQSIQR